MHHATNTPTNRRLAITNYITYRFAYYKTSPNYLLYLHPDIRLLLNNIFYIVSFHLYHNLLSRDNHLHVTFHSNNNIQKLCCHFYNIISSLEDSPYATNYYYCILPHLSFNFHLYNNRLHDPHLHYNNFHSLYFHFHNNIYYILPL